MLKNKIYWNVSYRESMRDEYINDPDLLIAESDIELLDREFKCLKKHKFKIIETNYELGFAVIEDKINTGEDIYKTYKTKDLVPFVLFRPNQCLSDIDGNLIKNGDSFYKVR